MNGIIEVVSAPLLALAITQAVCLVIKRCRLQKRCKTVAVRALVHSWRIACEPGDKLWDPLWGDEWPGEYWYIVQVELGLLQRVGRVL